MADKVCKVSFPEIIILSQGNVFLSAIARKKTEVCRETIVRQEEQATESMAKAD